MTTYLVTGSSRGIGLELVRQLVAKSPSDIGTIFASARSSNAPLQQLVDQHPGRVHFIPLDVTSRDSITDAVQRVSQTLNGRGLDVLINNAGIQNASSVEQMNDLEETFQINVNGVHNVTRAFLPLLRTGKSKKILNISSSLGCFALQSIMRISPTPSYKISKAALNMLTLLYSQELGSEGFTVFCMSPGWLRTDLGSSGADLPVSTGVSSVLDTLLAAGPKLNGQFVDIHVPGWRNRGSVTPYDGARLPW